MIEWAVIERGFQNQMSIHKGGLGSREEAEAWLAAIKLTRARAAQEAFYEQDAILLNIPLQVGRREISDWRTE